MAVVGGDGEGRRDAKATVDDVRKAVTRSLPFLEKGGTAWMQTKGCASCHHVPMMLWSHYEARQRGFAVSDTTEAQEWAVSTYLGHPDFTPTGQDKGFPKTGPGPGAVYLAARTGRGEETRGQRGTRETRGPFRREAREERLVALKLSQPPLVDDDDVATMFILLAMDRAEEEPTLRSARERAMVWLKSAEPRPETQPLALRVMTAAKFDKADKVRPLVTRLLARQNEDGGWSQIDSRPSDALATGQALCCAHVRRGTGREPFGPSCRGLLRAEPA